MKVIGRSPSHLYLKPSVLLNDLIQFTYNTMHLNESDSKKLKSKKHRNIEKNSVWARSN